MSQNVPSSSPVEKRNDFLQNRMHRNFRSGTAIELNNAKVNERLTRNSNEYVFRSNRPSLAKYSKPQSSITSGYRSGKTTEPYPSKLDPIRFRFVQENGAYKEGLMYPKCAIIFTETTHDFIENDVYEEKFNDESMQQIENVIKQTETINISKNVSTVENEEIGIHPDSICDFNTLKNLSISRQN